MPLSIMEIEDQLCIIVEAWGLPLRRPKPFNLRWVFRSIYHGDFTYEGRKNEMD